MSWRGIQHSAHGPHATQDVCECSLRQNSKLNMRVFFLLLLLYIMCGPRQLPMWCRDAKSLGKKVGFKGKQKLGIDSPFLSTFLIATILSISSYLFYKYICSCRAFNVLEDS